MKQYKNTVVNGDCVEVMKNIEDNYISCCITDPPYNYEFIGHTWNENEIKRRKDKVKNSKTLVKNIPYGSGLSGGTRNENWYRKNRNNIIEYQKWCESWGKELYRICKPGATVLVFNSTRTVAHVQVALENVGFYARDIVVYRRNSGIPKGLNLKNKLEKMNMDISNVEGLHSCLRNEWESICVLQKPLVNNYIETYLKHGTGLFNTLKQDGGFQSNIIENIKRDDVNDYNIHCTVKPIELMKQLINIFCPKDVNSILIDPFAGSGTTLVASKILGIDYIGIEIEKSYIDIIEKRLK